MRMLVTGPARDTGLGPLWREKIEGLGTMRLSDLTIDTARLAEICRRYHVLKAEAFGSFVTGEADEQSDLDLLVTFGPGASIGLEFVSLQQELEALFARHVDLLTRKSVDRSANRYFRRFALQHTQVL